jgi:hypothetical protein
MNLEEAVGTAKHAEYANPERVEEADSLARRVAGPVGSTPLPFAYSASFAI